MEAAAWVFAGRCGSGWLGKRGKFVAFVHCVDCHHGIIKIKGVCVHGEQVRWNSFMEFGFVLTFLG